MMNKEEVENLIKSFKDNAKGKATFRWIGYLISIGRLKEAEDELKNIEKENTEGLDLRHIYNHLGIINFENKNFEKAELYYNKALSLARLGNDFESISANLHELSLVCDARGNVKQAIEFCKEALNISLEYNEIDSFTPLRTLAIFYDRIGNLEESCAIFNIVREYTLLDNDLSGQAKTYNSLGIVNQRLGNINLAIENFIMSLEIKRITGDHKGFAVTKLNLCNLMPEPFISIAYPGLF